MRRTNRAVAEDEAQIDLTPMLDVVFIMLIFFIVTASFIHAAKEAIQMHGGIGVTDEHDIGFYMKRAQATYMTFGRPSQHRRRWAELHGY